MSAREQDAPPALPVRPARALLVAGYLVGTTGALALLLLAGGWGLLGLPVLAGLLYLALDPFRAALLLFAVLPPFPELLPLPVRVALWYVPLAATAIAWLIALTRGRAEVPRHYLAAYGAFVAAVLLSTAFGVDQRYYVPSDERLAVQLRIIQSLLASLVSVFLLPAVRDREQLRRLAWWIVLGGVAETAAMFLVEIYNPAAGPDILSRSHGLFASVHYAGLFELLYLTLAVALLASERRRWQRLLMAVSIPLFLLGLYASRSRTAWAILPVLLLLMAWQDRATLLPRIRFAHALVAGILVAVLVPFVVARVFVVGFYGPAWQGRVLLNRLGLGLFEQYPLTGIGFGLHTDVIPAQLTPHGFLGIYIHTYYVTLLAETGLFGFSAFMLIVGLTVFHFLKALRAFRAAGDEQLYHVTRAFFLTFCAVLGMFLTQGETGFRLFWAMVAMALVARRLARGPGPR